MKKPIVFLPTLFKSMFYQANWNVNNMQGTGFIWLVKDLFRRNNVVLPEEWKAKSPEYFNTNPYLITFILGMLMRESRDNVSGGSYCQTYASALAALGDSFFWHSLRPFTFFLSIWVALLYPQLAIIFYLVLYNFFNLGFRFLGFYYGYSLGRNVILIFRKIAFNRWTQIFDSMSTFMAGAAFAAALRYEADDHSLPMLRAVILFIIGVIVARTVKAPIGFMCAAAVLGFMLIVGM